MDVDGGELAHIRRGALLHDIGKMGIPDNVLLKPGPLNDEEWIIMRTHLRCGGRVGRPAFRPSVPEGLAGRKGAGAYQVALRRAFRPEGGGGVFEDERMKAEGGRLKDEKKIVDC